MKKIIALMLVLSCVFALGSCKRKNKDEAPDIDAEAIATFQAKIDASMPETAIVTVTLKSALETLESEYNVTYNQDGTATVVYTYEKLNEISDNASGDYKSVGEGTVTIAADGKIVGSLEGAEALQALTFDLNLDPSKLASGTVSVNILSATVKAENTADVLGVNVGVDANVIVSVGPLGVASVVVSYNTSAGPVEIVSTYTYYVAPEEEEGEEGEEGSEEGDDATIS